MKALKRLHKQRQRRKFRTRNRVRKTGRLRLSVHRSNKHIYAQVIDDSLGQTLASACSREAELLASGESGGNQAAAQKVGKLIAERALEKGVQEVAFDRGEYRYHGRVAALADAAREAGLKL